MCFYLYGSLNGEVPEEAYNTVHKKYEYKIARGTKHDIKMAIKAAVECPEADYRITDWICDCDSPVGKHDPEDSMIVALRDLILDLSGLPGAMQINICKTFTGKQNKKEIKIDLKGTDIAKLLADLQENCLYSINLN